MVAQQHECYFRVHARHMDGQYARLITEQSFEAAAIAYIEDLFPGPENPEVQVIVHEIATGREHCFCLDLASGDASPCR